MAEKHHHHEHDQREPLLSGHPGHPGHPGHGGSLSLYNSGPRVRRDTRWTIAYAVASAAVLILGVVLCFTGSPDFFAQVDPEHLADPASCPAGAFPPRRRGLFAAADPDQPPSANLSALLAHPVSAVSCTLAGSLFLGFVFVLGFRHMAKTMITLAITLQVAAPVALLIWAAVAGQVGLAVSMGLYAGLLVVLFLLWKEQIGLVGRLLSVTGHALADNSGLLVVGLAMPVVWGVVLFPTLAFMGAALTNGSVVPNMDRRDMQMDGAGRRLLGALLTLGKKGKSESQCVDVDGDPVSCCVWQVDAPAQLYLAFLGVWVTWTTLLLGQIKLFTVAGTVAQWYFTPAAPSSISSYAPITPANPRRKGRVTLALRHALGPSFGSLCAGAALLTVVSYIRQALDMAERQMRHDNVFVRVVAAIVVAILRVFLSLVEFLTRFTTVRMAITGEDFITSAHGAVDLLRRNALNAFGVWWLPPFILGNCQFIMSVLFGTLVWGTSSLAYHSTDSGDVSSVVLGVVAGLVAMVVLSFLKGLLLNILDAVFVCFAMDRDQAVVTRVEVHEVLQEVPGVKAAVFQQPDGDLAYGAPAAAGPGRV